MQALLKAVTRLALRLLLKPWLGSSLPLSVRRRWITLATRSSGRPRDVGEQELWVGDVRMLRLRAGAAVLLGPTPVEGREAILFVHGGGFIGGGGNAYVGFAARLAEVTGADVYLLVNTGNRTQSVTGNVTATHLANYTQTITGSNTVTVLSDHKVNVLGMDFSFKASADSETIGGIKNENILGAKIESVVGLHTDTKLAVAIETFVGAKISTHIGPSIEFTAALQLGKRGLSLASLDVKVENTTGPAIENAALRLACAAINIFP